MTGGLVRTDPLDRRLPVRRTTGLSARLAESGPRTRSTILAGTIVTVVFVGGFGGWASLAPLSSASVAGGMVVAEGERRTVQHLEGGIVRDILVREGDRVRSGQVLVRMHDAQAAAAVEVLRVQRDLLHTQEVRLMAEADGAADPAFPEDLVSAARHDPRVASAVAGQEALFRVRRDAFESQIQTLRHRMDQENAAAAAAVNQIRFYADQIRLIREEAAGVQQLLDKGLERRPRLLALQRAEADLMARSAEAEGLMYRSREAVAGLVSQIEQLKSTRRNEVGTELQQVRSQLAATTEKLRGEADVLERRDVLAPLDGIVMGLRVFSPGAVVRPGDPILDIVPSGEDLVVKANVPPLDIDDVHVGLDAEVRLSAYRQRVVPPVRGEVFFVSADAVTDPKSGTSFYEAKIRIDPDELARNPDIQMQAGMPAEIMILTGARSFFGYLLQPMVDGFHRAFRED
ncbi:MAG TPA: HlyD family type I secretion periplasmic adaptor subunit [Azospirillaceae bacterium]|nr:HlyD family type I secretion periplasmic adaptor subunit [Azospirillaceae bacterium]